MDDGRMDRALRLRVLALSEDVVDGRLLRIQRRVGERLTNAVRTRADRLITSRTITGALCRTLLMYLRVHVL